jgi:D-galactarolactone cycloisomerase
MKITQIEPILIDVPLKLSGAVPMSSGEARRSIHTLLVKVDTDEGVIGYGEAFGLAGSWATHAAIKHIVAPRCIGRDPAQIADLMNDLYRRLYNCGRNGPIVFGMSGIEIALWDIAGKCAGLPLYRLLGGSARNTLPAYASLLRYGEARAVTDHIAQALERGYRLIKLHENNVDIIRAARKAAGPDIPIMVDCTCPWTVDEALEMSRRLEDQNLTWLEEPIYPPDDHAGLARLRAASRIPIAAGENVSNVFEFKRLFEAGALSFAQPSITKVGGVTEIRKVFALAESFGVTVVPHSPYFGPGLVASVHVCAASTRPTWIERYYCDFEVHPFGDIIHPQRGDIVIPQGPGLGLEPDLKVVEKLRIA